MNSPLNQIQKLLAPPDITGCQKILCIQPHPDDNEIGMGCEETTYLRKTG